MTRLFLIVLALNAVSFSAISQDYHLFRKTMDELQAFAAGDSIYIQTKVNRWWNERKSKGQIPLVIHDSVSFFYRGEATSVAWVGDFNSWGSKPFDNKGARIANTNIWMLTCSFPADARLDYKIIINGKDWVDDPDNPLQQWTGAGGGSANSEVRMPRWKQDEAQKQRAGIPRGTVKPSTIHSTHLGYDVNYSLYLPAGVKSTEGLPFLYVTDGNEYSDPRLGNMIVVLDNLIADNKIRSMAVVFIDQREPGQPSNNRRMTELGLHEEFLAFVTHELIPYVEGPSHKQYDPEYRGILGTSLGGLSSAYFAFKRPDVFNRVAIQSPAFWYKPEIFALAETPMEQRLHIFLSTGLIYDAGKESARMRDILQQQGHTCHYIEVQEGHSWGNWRNLLDDALVALYGIH